MEKRIEVIENFPVQKIKNGFGNPRKIKKKKAEELQQSLDTLGDFGLILLDEEDNVIAGNQRVELMKRNDPDAKVLVKKLYGYTESELSAGAYPVGKQSGIQSEIQSRRSCDQRY